MSTLRLYIVLVFVLVISFGIANSEKRVSRYFDDVETKFSDYIVQFNKSYRFNVDEYRRRFITFQVRLLFFFFHFAD